MMESVGKRKRRSGHADNSLIADFISLRESEMVETGPKKPRWGSGEMWLTPDPLTPLENFGRGKRRRSVNQPVSTEEKKTESEIRASSERRTSSEGRTGSGRRRRRVRITPFKRKSAGGGAESANTGPLLTPISSARGSDGDVLEWNGAPANKTASGSSKKQKQRISTENKENKRVDQTKGHESHPEIEENGDIASEIQTFASPVHLRTPSKSKEESIAETPQGKEPSTVLSAGTRELRSVLKDIHTLSSLRRQTTRNRVSFGRFVTVAEYRHDNAQEITQTSDSLLLSDSPSPEKHTTVSLPEVRGQYPAMEEEEEDGVREGDSLLIENSPPEDSTGSSSPDFSSQSQEEEGEEEEMMEVLGGDSLISGIVERLTEEDSEILTMERMIKDGLEVGMEEHTSKESLEPVSEGSSESEVAESGESSIQLEPLGEEEEEVGCEEVEGELEDEIHVEELEDIRSGRYSSRSKRKGSVVIQKKKKKPAKTLPRAIVKNLFTLSSKRRVTRDAMDLILKFSEVYLKQASKDVAVFAAHAGRKTVDVDDVVLLLRRQRVVSDKRPFEYIVNEHLPLEYAEQLLPCVTAGKDITPQLK